MKSRTQTPPLARSTDRDVLDWGGIDPLAPARPKDLLGLQDEDRLALGMSQARTVDLAPSTSGDAQAALADLLHRGVALGKRDAKRR